MRNETEKRLLVFLQAMASSEISTTETVPQCPHPASETAFWARSYLPLYFPVMNVQPFGVTVHSGHKSHCPVNPQHLQALAEAFTEHPPPQCTPTCSKVLISKFNVQGTNISIRSLYPIALISILLLQQTYKSRFVLLPGEKLLVTEFISILLWLDTDCLWTGWHTGSTNKGSGLSAIAK